MGSLLFSALPPWFFEPIMLLSNLVVLGTGAQSVTADKDTRRSDNLNKYEGVRQ